MVLRFSHQSIGQSPIVGMSHELRGKQQRPHQPWCLLHGSVRCKPQWRRPWRVRCRTAASPATNMEVEDPMVAPADDCRLVLGSSLNAAKAASALTVSVDNPGVHFKRFCRCGLQRPAFPDVEIGDPGFIQDLHTKKRNQKLMVLILTVACIVNLAVTGIGIAYLRLHFAQEDILSIDEVSPDARRDKVEAASLYSHIKAMIKRRVKAPISTKLTSATPGYKPKHRQRTRWTPRFHFPTLPWFKSVTTSMAPKIFKAPSGYSLT
nr:uncharacterized protein LOC126539078 [Dermacentor andersoni]